jgi:hypothetical protein
LLFQSVAFRNLSVTGYEFTMAEVIGVIAAVKPALEVLLSFGRISQRYRAVPQRLVDLRESLEACEIAPEAWKARWNIEIGRPGYLF